jgi:hypothetical protein
MESEKYRKFLEIESKKAPLEKKQSDMRERFWISWGESVDRAPIEKGTSDIIDSLYFGNDPSRTVVIDRKVAKILQERLRGLEEENMRLHKRVRLMRLIMYALILIIFLMAIAIVQAEPLMMSL